MAEIPFKFIIVGPSGCGKSSLLQQFTDGVFDDEHDVTIGVEFGAYTTEIDGKHVKLQLWDTAGQESFRSITSSYYRGAHCALLVYDVTRRNTFEYLEGWLLETRQHSDPNIVIILVGNKVDLDHLRVVSTEEGKQFAEENELIFIETSAKTAYNVSKAFLESANIIYQNIQSGIQTLDNNDDKIDVNSSQTGKQNGTCPC
mmetsp:Transcript_8532/g.14731  ORF Transcript_8532/g.14731 Transcript_8532/m.14731 type:complete len:201 (+) Transcript_8532:44-646(+)